MRFQCFLIKAIYLAGFYNPCLSLCARKPFQRQRANTTSVWGSSQSCVSVMWASSYSPQAICFLRSLKEEIQIALISCYLFIYLIINISVLMCCNCKHLSLLLIAMYNVCIILLLQTYILYFHAQQKKNIAHLQWDNRWDCVFVR